MKKCPDCNMMLEDDVVVCPACTYSFEEGNTESTEVAEENVEAVEETTETVEENSLETEVQDNIAEKSDEDNSEEATVTGEYVCVKCGNKIDRPSKPCSCGGYAMNAIPAGQYIAQKGTGVFGWIISVLLAPIVLIITFIMTKASKNPTRKVKEMFSISGMSVLIYALIIGFYFLSQFLGGYLAV